MPNLIDRICNVNLAAAILFLAGSSLTCNSPSSPAPSITAACGAPQCRSFDRSDGVHYHLCSPNGGETLHVGDTVLIEVCSEDPAQYNLDDMEKQLSINGGPWIVFYTEDALDTRSDQKHWIIPDSVDYLDEQANLHVVSTVSDSVLLRVAAYGESSDRTVDFDCSDGAFSIRRR